MDANTLKEHRWLFNCKGTSAGRHFTHHNARSLTLKSFGTYSNKTCTKRSIVIPAGKWVTLKQVYVKKNDGVYAIQIQYGSKTCWIRNASPYENKLFLGVENCEMFGGAVVDW